MERNDLVTITAAVSVSVVAAYIYHKATQNSKPVAIAPERRSIIEQAQHTPIDVVSLRSDRDILSNNPHAAGLNRIPNKGNVQDLIMNIAKYRGDQVGVERTPHNTASGDLYVPPNSSHDVDYVVRRY